MRKRLLAVGLSVSLMTGLLPHVSFAVGEAPYSPRTTETMVLPKAIWTNKPYLTSAALRNSRANYVNLIQGLSGKDTYKNLKLDPDKAAVALDQTIRDNKVDAGIRMTWGYRTMDGHFFGDPNIVESRVQFNNRWFETGDNRYQFEGVGLYQDENYSYPMRWDHIKVGAHVLSEQWYATPAQTKDLTAYLIDDQAPAVTDCAVTYDNGTPAPSGVFRTQMDNGDAAKLTLTLSFSEYIRFANNGPKHEPKLRFMVKPAGRIVMDLVTQEADFVRLYDNKMEFSYDCSKLAAAYPDQPEITDFVIDHIVPLADNPDFGRTIELVLLPEEMFHTMGAPALTSDNLITDLAGNPVEAVKNAEGQPVDIPMNPATVKLDGSTPKVSGVSLKRVQDRWDAGGKPVPYVIPGDQLVCTLRFDEPVNAAAGSVTVTYNLGDSGQVVTAKNREAVTNSCYVTFEPITITDSMAMASSSGSMIYLTHLSGTFADTAGNPFDTEDTLGRTIFPDTEYQMDTKAPEVTVGAPVELAEDTLCLSLNMIDPAGSAGSVSGGVDGQQASFHLSGFPQRFQYKGDTRIRETQHYFYYVSSDGRLTADALADKWIEVNQSGFVATDPNAPQNYFHQIGGTSYLYLKIPDVEISNPQLTLTVQDQAGNTTSYQDNIHYTLDKTPPVFQRASDIRVTANPDGQTYTLSQDTVFYDFNGVDANQSSVSFGTMPDRSEPSGAVLSVSGNANEPQTLTMTLNKVLGGQLIDTTITYTVKDSRGNTFTKNLPFQYNLNSFDLIAENSPVGKNGYIANLHLQNALTWDLAGADADPKTLILVKDPTGENSYAGAEFDKLYLRDHANNANLLTATDVTWRRFQLSGSTTDAGQLRLTPVSGSTDFVRKLGTEGGYLGNVSYLMLSGEGITFNDFTGSNVPNVPVSIRERSARMAGYQDTADGVSLGLTAQVEPIGWELDPGGIHNNNYKISMPVSGDTGLPERVNTDISGRQVEVTLGLPQIPGLTWDDVDAVTLRLQGEGDSTEPFAAVELTPTGQSQTVTIPTLSMHPGENFGLKFTVLVNYKFHTHSIRGILTDSDASLVVHQPWGADHLTCIRQTVTLENGVTVPWERSFDGSEHSESIPLILQPGVQGQLYFDNGNAYDYDSARYVRVWNATGLSPEQEENAKQAAPWKQVGNLSDTDPISLTGLLPQEGQNTLRYQSFNVSDGLSLEHTLLFDITMAPPTLELAFTPDAADGYVKQRTLQVVRAAGIYGDPMTVMVQNGDTFTELPAEGIVIEDTTPRLCYALDLATGGVASVMVQAEKIDQQAPQLTLDTDVSLGDNLYFTVEDAFIDPASFADHLYLKYNDDSYTTLLKQRGLVTDEEGYFNVSNPTATMDPFRPDPSTGFEEVTFSVASSRKAANVSLQLTSPKDSSGYQGTLSAYYIDQAGTKSAVMTTSNLDVPAIQVTGTIQPDTGAEQTGPVCYPRMDLFFNHPVSLLEPRSLDVSVRRFEDGARDGMYQVRSAMPVYAPGTYSIQVWDAFGDEHTVSYTVPEDAFRGDSLEVTTVNLPDQGYVKVNIHAEPGSQFKMELPTAEDYTGPEALNPRFKAGEGSLRKTDGSHIAFGTFCTDAELQATKNGVFKVLVKNRDGTLTERLIHVLDNQEPVQLRQVWSYPNGLFSDNRGSYTLGHATVTLVPYDYSRTVLGNNSLTFTTADAVGTTKSITITDDQGMEQTCQVTLNVAIRPTEETFSTPDLTVTLAGLRSGRYTPIGCVTAPDNGYQTLLNAYGAAAGFRLTAATTSPLPVKAILLPYQAATEGLTYTSANAVISGVTISGSLVTVTERAARFSLVLVDRDNRCSPRMDFDGGFAIDTTPPVVGEITKEVSSYSGVKITLAVTDDQSSFEQLEAISPSGVSRKNGKFVYNATENRELVFMFRDQCGNLVTTKADITEVDTTKPTAKLVSYSPAGGSQTTLPTVTNRDITAYLAFDKNLRSTELEILDGGNYRPVTDVDGVTLTKLSESTVAITFTRDANVQVKYQALNHQYGTPFVVSIPAGTIDKTPPVVTCTVTPVKLTNTAAAPYAAAITVIPGAGETVYHNGKPYDAATPFTERVQASGSYIYTFTDRAGNAVDVTQDVAGLDTKPLTLTASNVPDQVDGSGASFQLTVNKPASITLGNGLSTNDNLVISAADGGTITVRLSQGGFFTADAVDAAGRRAGWSASIAPGDMLPPAIRMSTDYVYLAQDSTAPTDEFLLSGVTITDDRSPREQIAVTVDRSAIDLTRPGTYAYLITASDERGNTASETRYLMVYDKTQTVVEVNGVYAKHTGVITTDTGVHTITVSLPDASVRDTAFEPYQVYCARGHLTAGEMKHFMTPLTAEGAVTGRGDRYPYDFTQDGWYTICVLRQNREVFLTHMLVR